VPSSVLTSMVELESSREVQRSQALRNTSFGGGEPVVVHPLAPAGELAVLVGVDIPAVVVVANLENPVGFRLDVRRSGVEIIRVYGMILTPPLAVRQTGILSSFPPDAVAISGG
jgi:hypothetical protein